MANKKTTGGGRQKQKEKKNIAVGVVHIQSTFNNTLVTITDVKGAAISWSSAGSVGGFKGTRKGTPFAAQLAAEKAARTAMEHGLRRVDVMVKGPGSGRETAIRALQAKLKARRAAIERETYRDPSMASQPLPHPPEELAAEATTLREELVNAGFETPSLDTLIDNPSSLRFQSMGEIIDDLDVIAG